MTPALDNCIRRGLESAIPEGELTVSKWAEQRRVVSQERVADPALAGMWRNDKTPYLTEIMDAVHSPGINEILFLKSSQVGGTEAGNNICGYFIDVDPATILYVAENEGKGRAWSIESFAPMIRDSPSLAAIFGEARQRDSNNMIESKAFRGGHFALGWATSPATLSSRPRRVIITDETDAFPPTKEGDPVKLAEARTKTAGESRVIVHITTPRDKETSRVLPLWEDSPQEKYFVPCPDCDEFQVLKWANVRWDDVPEEAYYMCDVCGVIIDHESKFEMLERGEWRVTNPEYNGRRRAFWINEIYSPFTTWGEMAVAFIEAKKNPHLLKVFTNTRLAEWWEETGETIEYADLTFKREEYLADVPNGVLVLTAGVDIQDDRIESEIVGWGRDFESWSIDYKVFFGSPSLYDVWDALSDFLLTEFIGEDERIYKVRAAGIDTGGHHTDQAYKFCKANSGRRWFALKGASVSGKPLVSKPSIVGKNKVRLFSVGTDTAKDEIFAFLKVEEPGTTGYCHFPGFEHYDEQHFKQLCAEKKITKYRAGVAYQQYIKVSTAARNEALDCRVYATAARAILNPNLDKLAKNHLKMTENKRTAPETGQKMQEIDEKAENYTPEKEVKTGSKKRIVVKNSPFRGGKRGNFASNY